MAYNEAEIINEMFNLYDKNNKIYSVDVIYNQLREILYNLVIYNDDDNINEIITPTEKKNETKLTYFYTF